jgi:hypothetical protein
MDLLQRGPCLNIAKNGWLSLAAQLGTLEDAHPRFSRPPLSDFADFTLWDPLKKSSEHPELRKLG